ncbi:hypothetical protein HGM15179_014452 [Zosterops borbonicus]|uniref:Ig-like domain-containing protein n=1 Tax=Zosterops borbonicus TaxID=364589 RepID=A0A8K1G716_9PASS|nr:hypothetical protein HGM15179_014452 [Zosterops borbonicus]
MWADPEELQVIQYLLTGLFANISSAEVSCVTLVGDIPILTVHPAHWSIRFHWPWVSQAAAEGDGEKIMSQYKIALHPLVVQFRAGCVLYPNTTSQGFLNVGWGGRDLVAFEVDKQCWEARQPSQVAELVSKSLNKQRCVRVLLEHFVSIWICQSNFLGLKRYGRASLERQELPVASVFARTPSPDQLLLVCHITGFYPHPISVAWLQDGQEVPPGPVLNTSPILPNADLTYQLRSVLAVAPRDGHSYVCHVRHQSLGTRSLLIPWGRENVLVKNMLKSLDDKPICEVLLNQQYFNGMGITCVLRSCTGSESSGFPDRCQKQRFSCLWPFMMNSARKSASVFEVGKEEEDPSLMLSKKAKLRQENSDVLELSHTLPMEVITAEKQLFDPEHLDNYAAFKNCLQRYLVPGTSSLHDHRGRTTWLQGKPGPVAPKGAAPAM